MRFSAPVSQCVCEEAWIFLSDTWRTVDGLFEILIMLSLSGVFFLNTFLELRGKKPSGPAKPGAPSDEG